MHVLLRDAGGGGRGFRALIERIAKKRVAQFETTLFFYTDKLLKDIVDHTPIDTGAAAGVTSNAVGEQKRPMYRSHAAFGKNIGNLVGDSGWQLRVGRNEKGLTFSIVNPEWDDYLKYYELGLAQPLPPAQSFWVYRALYTQMRELKSELRS